MKPPPSLPSGLSVQLGCREGGGRGRRTETWFYAQAWKILEMYREILFFKDPTRCTPSPSVRTHIHSNSQNRKKWGGEMEEGRFIEAKLSDIVPELLLSWRSEGWACNQVCRLSSLRVSSYFPPLGSTCFPFLFSTAHNATVNFKKFLVYDERGFLFFFFFFFNFSLRLPTATNPSIRMLLRLGLLSQKSQGFVCFRFCLFFLSVFYIPALGAPSPHKHRCCPEFFTFELGRFPRYRCCDNRKSRCLCS